MSSSLQSVLRSVGRRLAEILERTHVIERSRLRATADLAWPRVVTGFARMSQQTADLAMVGIVLGSPAIAGLAFAYAYWQVGNRLSLGLSGGTISLVSQYYGANNVELANRVIGQSYVLAAVISLPLSGLFFWQSDALVGLLGAEPAALRHGSTYLTVLAPALFFEYCNKIASRVFAAIGDTLTPMAIRAGGAVVNIVLNVVLIFGLDLGVVGAAIGTFVATASVTAVFMWGLLGRQYPIRDAIPVTLSFSESRIDAGLLRPIARVSAPLMFQEFARALVVFPLLAIASVFGSTVVAAFEIARRVRGLINCPSWGFSLAASSLVGRHLGAGEEGDATAYGREILRLSVVSFILLSVVVVAFANQIARLFITDPEAVELTASFVRIAAIASIGLGIDKTATGVLRGAGDTRWPFYAALVGLYVFTVPVAYLGVVTPLGTSALYLALVLETFVPAAITSYRYRGGKWRGVSRSLRERAQQTTD